MNKEPLRVKLEVDNNTIARFWLIALGIVSAIGLIFWAKSALVILGMSIFLAVAINPLVNRLAKSKLFKGKRGPAAVIAYVGVIFLILVAMAVIVPALVEQITNIIKNAPNMLNDIFDGISKLKFMENWNIEDVRQSFLTTLQNNAQNWIASIGGSVFSGIGSIATSVVSAVLLIVTSLLISIELPSLKRYAFGFYRNKKRKKHHEDLLYRMYSVIVGFVGGQMMVALINSLVACLVIFILSYIFPIPQGMITLFGLTLFLGAIVPMFGATIGMIITALFMVLYSWQSALIFVVYYLIYQQIEGNVIGPFIQSKRVDLSLLLILISITIGTFMSGLLGGVIAIPLAGCLKILFEDFIERWQQNHN